MKSYAAALAAVLSGLALAAPARADPSSINNEITFLKALSDKGIEFRETEDRATMIDRGYQFCRVLAAGYSYPDAVRAVARLSDASISAENKFASTAVDFFCPEHRYQVLVGQPEFPPEARISRDEIGQCPVLFHG
ncbi:DUF732 domain-containing protein (plasmid) [Mycobacterium ulcerans]|nr:DUF732 domain-containing protein [Mycobacterium ulcerans]